MSESSNIEAVRYTQSPDPVRTNGRDIDTGVAELTGEGAQQIASPRDAHLAAIADTWPALPETGADPTYYDRPLLKESVWTLDIPLYYFVGGAAGAALTLGAAAQLTRDRDLREFSRNCHWIGIAGSTLGAAFLIHDLGRPSRFLNMMRVFRPTSPMNVGTWILGSAAPTAIAAGLFINRGGLLGMVGEVCGYLSGIFGAGLAGYTGVLVSNSAIPVWQEARRWMPVMFVASGMTAAASILDLMPESPRVNRITLLFGTAGRVIEIAASQAVERSASVMPRVGAPFREGAAGRLWKGAAVFTVCSLGLRLLSGRSRGRRRAAGVMGAVGSLLLRLAVHYISDASARDPRASFHQQRQLAPGESTRKEASISESQGARSDSPRIGGQLQRA